MTKKNKKLDKVDETSENSMEIVMVFLVCKDWKIITNEHKANIKRAIELASRDFPLKPNIDDAVKHLYEQGWKLNSIEAFRDLGKAIKLFYKSEANRLRKLADSLENMN